MSDLTFYLGTHQPAWLWDKTIPADVAMFVSHGRLDGGPRGPRVSTYPAAVRDWALDSRGFTVLQQHGRWPFTAAEYVAAVRRYDREIGRLGWAAPMDWMCEPIIRNGGVVAGKRFVGTGLTVAEHLRLTVDNFVELEQLWDAAGDDAESPFMPVLQGFELADYLACWDLYDAAGVNLADYPVVGVGSVCRRESTDEIGQIMAALRARDAELPIHGFGVKSQGLALYSQHMSSADSMAWSLGARALKRPMAGCEGRGHINCANCSRYALAWRDRVLEATR